MNKYIVWIKEAVAYPVEIEASNAKEAVQIVDKDGGIANCEEGVPAFLLASSTWSVQLPSGKEIYYPFKED